MAAVTLVGAAEVAEILGVEEASVRYYAAPSSGHRKSALARFLRASRLPTREGPRPPLLWPGPLVRQWAGMTDSEREAWLSEYA